MRKGWRQVVCLSALFAAMLLPPTSAAISQSRGGSTARSAEFARIQDLLNDPDANARLAHMEEIVGSTDASRVQIAIRIAASSDDVDLRSLALRAYLASRPTVVFQLELPERLRRLAAASSESEQRQAQAALNAAGLARVLNFERDVGGSIALHLRQFGINAVSARAFFGAPRSPEQWLGTAIVTADTFVVNAPIQNVGACTLRVAIASTGSLNGEFRCAEWGAALGARAPLF
jgi:hypothetical protein